MSANSRRGEVDIVLDGITHVLRPTFAALSRIEHELTSGFPALATRLSEGKLTLEELATIVSHCLEPARPRAGIGESLLRSGIAQNTMIVAELFSHILEGFDEKIA